MPTDSGNQFPMPIMAAPKVGEAPATAGEGVHTPPVKLTDEVAPDLSTPPSFSETAPSTPPPPPPPPPPAPAPVAASPASFTPARPFPLVTLLLILIAIGATAATYFFYQQSQSLNQQLTQLSQTLSQQKTQPTASLSETLTPTPVASLSASLTPVITTPVNTNPRSAFDQIAAVMLAAQKQYPNAQLIMITGTDVQSDTQIVLKYWFRQNPTDQKYLYIMKQIGQDLSLVDQQVYVTPDNNIPSLNQLVQNNQLGADLTTAFTTALSLCPANYGCSTAPATAQYIKTSTTLWQITFKASDNPKPFVVQIDATTGKVIFQSQ